MVNGVNRWILARPRASSNLARFSEHGINGLFLLSNTKTAIVFSQLLPLGAL